MKYTTYNTKDCLPRLLPLALITTILVSAPALAGHGDDGNVNASENLGSGINATGCLSTTQDTNNSAHSQLSLDCESVVAGYDAVAIGFNAESAKDGDIGLGFRATVADLK